VLERLPRLSLILGGAASGKSAFAEGVVTKSGRPRTYVATAQAFDAEMSAKIAAHRAGRGRDWRTLEAPLDVVGALGQVAATEVVLLDCATLWLSNVMLEAEAAGVGENRATADLDAACDRLLAALADCPAPAVVVSNETGMGIVPDTRLGRAFRNAQGRLNQRLAAQANWVVLVAAGLPMILKHEP
jgi:adenosylcobinamide kinase/adenosylcobinamide-phosphate guanylyltransferase